MSAQHTPGPWVIDENRWDGAVTIINDRHEPVLSAAWEGGSQTSLLVSEADLRLIAAAPALLEMLEDARTSLSITRTNIMCEIGRCADPSESRWAGVPEQLAKRIAKIDATIALAKGESA